MTKKNAIRAACSAFALALAVPASAGDVSYDQGRLRAKNAAKARYTLVASSNPAPCECHGMRAPGVESGEGLRERMGAHEHMHPAPGAPERPTTGVDRR